MAEKRQPLYRIAIAGPGFRRVSELFPAGLFPGGRELSDRYRVRIDRAWHMPGGVKYAFLPLEEALAVAGWPHIAAPRPRLGRGDRRRLLLGRADDGTALYEAAVVMTNPTQGPDGRWRVFLVGRREPVLCDELCAVERSL